MSRCAIRAGGRKPRRFQISLLLYAIPLLAIFVPAELMARKSPPKSNLPKPEIRIPVEALGYTAPAAKPAFDFQALVSLNYIDADHLLFTFNVKGLVRRDDRCSGATTQRMVRAVVLDIPTGKVEKQADWELYDLDDYLWNLGNGQFLLRSCSQLRMVGASLDPQPLIEPSGSVQWIGFSPDRSLIVIEEASQSFPSKQTPSSDSESRPASKVDVEFVRLHPLGIVARFQSPVPGSISTVASGILEVLIGKHDRWGIDIQPFQAKERNIATIYSTCRPRLTPLTDTVIVASTCTGPDNHNFFRGFDLNGAPLWQMQLGENRHDPKFLLTQNGAHFAIESLHTKAPLAPLDPLNRELIDGEVIDIYDTRPGTRIGSLQTTPVYTAGTNADFSPDGTHLAVLHDGAIEIYALSDLAKNHP